MGKDPSHLFFLNGKVIHASSAPCFSSFPGCFHVSRQYPHSFWSYTFSILWLYHNLWIELEFSNGFKELSCTPYCSLKNLTGQILYEAFLPHTHSKRTQGKFWRWRKDLLPWLWWWYDRCMHRSKLIKLHAWNMSSFLYINYTSLKL